MKIPVIVFGAVFLTALCGLNITHGMTGAPAAETKTRKLQKQLAALEQQFFADWKNKSLAELEHIIRHSSERYVDTETGRTIVVGHHGKQLVMVPSEVDRDTITPVTVHAITRQQIRFRLRTGRFTHE